ncbi:hypothetical protein [Ferrimonas sp. SCSIO 43195]|uniref:hypothetical protein n=1 Tax=Ferrimonas sp. SCSIO 43195 TaxID=2822844 RepID=UPI002075F31D|nr:hypothetical protein [Ferrimonas sp. SCSIO 43195]USD35744.1 hypothetical protein J8Z22_11865 [Ferrimonas sp. SCSIO 43195]
MKRAAIGVGLLCAFAVMADDAVPYERSVFRLLDTESGLCLTPSELNEGAVITLQGCGSGEGYWVNLGTKVAPLLNTTLALSGDVQSLFLASESALAIDSNGTIKGQTELFEDEVCLDRWATPVEYADESQSVYWLTECQYANQDEKYSTQYLIEQGGVQQWHPDVLYQQGEVVIFEGKLWRTRWESKDSQPIAGNYEWHSWVELDQ